MKIIFHRYNSICEPDYLEAFSSLGLEVIQDCEEMVRKNISLEERVDSLGRMILSERPLFVFSINFYPYISMVCERLGCLYLCVSVDCPVPEIYSTQIRNACNRVFLFDRRQYEDVVSENPKGIFHIPLGVNVSRIDSTIGIPDWNKIRTNQDFYRYPVSFVGSLYREKNPYPKMKNKLDEKYQGLCEGLLRAQSIFPGQELLEQSIPEVLIAAMKEADQAFYSSDLSFCNIDRFVAVNDYLSVELSVRDRQNLLARLSLANEVHLFTKSDTGPLCHQITANGGTAGGIEKGAGLLVHGGVASLTEMPKVFRLSKINLNHSIRSIQKGLPQRIWDVLGSGGFLLTNSQEEIFDCFEVGKHLETYDSFEEAEEKIAYYLAHEDERLAIARAGYELVKEKGTVFHRVMDMIRMAVG